MKFSEFASNFEDILNQKGDEGIEEVFSILIEICIDDEMCHEMRALKSNFLAEYRKLRLGYITHTDFRIPANLCREYIWKIIYNKEETWVNEEWMELEKVKDILQSDDGLHDEELDGKEAIDQDILANNELDVDGELLIPKEDITIPNTQSTFLSPEDLNKFKRLLTNAQGSFRCNNYSESYETCFFLATEIESSSIQLLELLLISYFKKIGAKSIVKDYVEDSGLTFLKVKLYIERLQNLIKNASKTNTTTRVSKANPSNQKSNESKDIVLRAEVNIRLICRLLINELKRSYSNKRFNGKQFDYIDQLETPEIKSFYTRVVQMAICIYSLQPLPLFFGKIMVEISGGGAFNWLKIDQNLDIKDNDNLKISPTQMRALMCEQFAPKIFGEFNQKSAANMLLTALKGKYITMKKARYNKWRDRWRPHINSFNSFLIGYSLFKDERFLEKPLHELSGKASLQWIDLDSRGELITSKICQSLRFNSIAIMASISRKIEANSESVISRISSNIVSKKLKELKTEYNVMQNSISLKNSKNLLEELIRIFKTSKACYAVNNNIQFLLLCKEILINNKIIDFVLKKYFAKQYLIVNAPDCLYLKFDALLELCKVESEILEHNKMNLSLITQREEELEYEIIIDSDNMGLEEFEGTDESNESDELLNPNLVSSEEEPTIHSLSEEGASMLDQELNEESTVQI